MQNALRFLMKKTSFFSIDNFFFSFFKGSKVITQRDKTFFFIRNLRAFCIYFLQVFKIRIWGHLPSAGIACKIYLWVPSNFDEKNALWLWLILPSENDGIYDNCICWHFLKPFTFCRYFQLHLESNNSIFLRQFFYLYNMRASHTTVYV